MIDLDWITNSVNKADTMGYRSELIQTPLLFFDQTQRGRRRCLQFTLDEYIACFSRVRQSETRFFGRGTLYRFRIRCRILPAGASVEAISTLSSPGRGFSEPRWTNRTRWQSHCWRQIDAEGVHPARAAGFCY